MNSGKDISTYSTALTGEPFLFNETRTIARFLVANEDMETLRKRNQVENLIMHKKNGSLKRTSSPIFRRLSIMTPAGQQILANGDIEAARIMLLIAIAKTDRLIRDFLTHVYAAELAVKSEKIFKSNIERYFEAVYDTEPSLRDRSELTKAKLKQQLMKIVVEAGLAQKQGANFLITRPTFSNKLMNQLVADGDTEYVKALGGYE
jgi:hypothetical protein